MNKKLSILLLTSKIFEVSSNEIKSMQEIAPDAEVINIAARDVNTEQIGQADIVFGWLDTKEIEMAKNLKWLHLPSAGADGFLNRESYCNKNIILTNSRGVFGLPIAEHVFSMIFAYNRNLPSYFKNQQVGKWERINSIKDFYGSTIGIIGFGNIGSEIAIRAKAFGAKVLAVKRTAGIKPDYVDDLYNEEGIDTLLEQSDYVILALPETPKTKGIISKARLAKMKKDAFIVNVGRGTLIDQPALLEALKSNSIGGAGLDVTDPEPLPQDNPLWSLPNVIITPHTSGGSPTNSLRRSKIFNKNLELYVEGKPLLNIVSFIEGY